MDIFQKAFNRERNKLYQKDGRPVNKLAGTGENRFSECALQFSSARKYFESGDPGRSLRAVNRAIELSTVDDWEQYALKAAVLDELEMYQEAMNAYEKAIEINSEDVKVYVLYHQIGDCYTCLGNYEKAIEFYSYAIELKKQHPDSRHDRDIEGNESGILLGGEFTHMYFNRGSSYYNLKRFDEAEKDCFSALEINPGYSNSYLLLYFIYSSTGQDNKAIEFLKNAVTLGNTRAQKLLNDLGIAYQPNTDAFTDEEKVELEACLHLTFGRHDLAEGKRRSLNLIKKGMNNIFPYFCLAFIYEVERNWKKCEEVSKAGLKFSEENILLLNTAGVSVCNQGRISEGLQYFEKGALAGDEMCAKNYKLWKSVAQN